MMTFKHPLLNTGYSVMTPGPTNIHEDVLAATAQNYTNPDLDHDFVAFYKETTLKIDKLINNSGETYLLCGEGILGLEAACASFIEPGDAVLTLSNGIFGRGFDDFSKMYGGQTVLFEGDLRRGLNPEDIDAFILEKGPFKVATVVHCETPSGITNDMSLIGPLLKKHGILSIVDSVSAIGGEPLDMDAWGLDVVLGGSQKALSAPPGMTMVSLSQKALEKLEKRTVPVPGFYTNLKIWKGYESNKWFPYTQPIHSIVGLSVALDRAIEHNTVSHHKKMADGTRRTIEAMGLEFYAKDHRANTVSTVLLPEGINFKPFFDHMKDEYGILVGGGFDFLENKIFRIGHMGENATEERLEETFLALEKTLETLKNPK